VRARLAERLANPAPRPHFLRVLLQDGEVRSAGAQGSHVLRSLARAAGLLEVPPETVLAEGAEVDVLLWD
jgi:molybdopterin biosynthesis enzyme